MIIQGDSLWQLKLLESSSVNCCITSPPYYALRDYGVAGQVGLEATVNEYIDKLCNIFDEVGRVLKPEGTLFVNLGDTYGGSGKGDSKELFTFKSKPKNQSILKSLCQIPSRFAIAMTDRGWILRNKIIWHKPNAMPNSAKDRFTVDYEEVFFFVKQKKYYFKQQLEKAVMNRWGGNKPMNTKNSKDKVNVNGLARERDMMPEFKNKRCVWSINTKPLKDSHFAAYPESLIEPMLEAGCPEGGTVLDPFFGAGTTGVVAIKQGKKYIGIELNPEYIEIAKSRIAKTKGIFDY